MIGNSEVAYEDWFSRGKEDAWFGQSKCPPEQDPEDASLYDLGYSEGTIKQSPFIGNSKAIASRHRGT